MFDETSEQSEESHSHTVVLLGIIITVVLGVWIQYEPYSFLRRDASFYATITRGLSENASLRAESLQPSSWYSGTHPAYEELDASWSNVALGVDGEWYPKHSFVMSAVAVPFYKLLGVNGLLLFNILGVVALLFSAYLLAFPVVRGPPLVFALVLLGTGSTFIDQSYLFSADIFSAAVVMVAFVCLSRRACLWSGFLFGMALWARPTLVLLIAPVAFVMSYKVLRRPEVRNVAVGMLPPILAGALANWLMFGAPWISGYDRILVVHQGLPQIESAQTLFTLSWSEGLERMFLNTQTGFWNNAPAALMGMVGLASLIRISKRQTAALTLAIVGYVAFFATYNYSHPRFFLAWMALLTAPLALLLQDVAGLFLGPFSETTPPRKRLTWPGIALVVLALLGWQLDENLRGNDTLTSRIGHATVSRNDVACDYYNMRHGRWECSRIERHLWEYTGLALGDTDCRFGGEKRDMLFFHPPLLGATKTLSFPLSSSDQALRLVYGLADGATDRATCFEVEVGGETRERLCADRNGTLKTHDIDLDGARTITFRTKGYATGRRHLCLEGHFAQ